MNCFENHVSREDLQILADSILLLDIPERDHVHAEKMALCDDDEYSLAFYEVAESLMAMLISGHPLMAGVRALSSRILAVEEIPYEVIWDDWFDTDKKVLTGHAMKIVENGTNGPNLRVAKRILNKKASVEEWMVAALHFSDVATRVADDERHLVDFVKDEARCDKEFAKLRRHLSLVSMKDDTFVMTRPFFPPWTDVGIWPDYWVGHGFGCRFHPKAEITN